MSKQQRDYWKSYYEKKETVGTSNSHTNVERTKEGNPIPVKQWELTVNDVSKLLNLKVSDDLLELCCGNGEVIGNLSPMCKSAVGVDYSSELLTQMKNKFGAKVKAVYSDVMDVKFNSSSFDVVIIYFSIQYFDEKEALLLIERSLKWLKSGGRLFVGDIPNELKKWDFIREPRHQKDYFQRVVDETPMIGNWFQPDFFRALSSYFRDIEVSITNQPDYQINSSYRFDVMIHKED